MISKEDVNFCYKYFLERDSENQDVIYEHQKARSVRELVESFVNSDEYKIRLFKSKASGLSGFLSQDVDLLVKYSKVFKGDGLLTGEDGFITDFMGIRHRVSDLPFLPADFSGRVFPDIPIPDDSWHSDAIEYISLFIALDYCYKDKFVMYELGAGWGPWMCAAAVAVKGVGKREIFITGVEGEANKIPLIERHLEKNGIRPYVEDDYEYVDIVKNYKGVTSTIVNGVVNSDGSDAFFPVVDISHYGASLIDPEGKSSDVVRVKGYTLEELFKVHNQIDFVHIDIQGYERILIEAAIGEIINKVRFIAIGTHTRSIEAFLIEFMIKNGFRLLREIPCELRKMDCLPEDMVEMTSVDGMQFYVNLSLVESAPE